MYVSGKTQQDREKENEMSQNKKQKLNKNMNRDSKLVDRKKKKWSISPSIGFISR